MRVPKALFKANDDEKRVFFRPLSPHFDLMQTFFDVRIENFINFAPHF